MTIEAILSSIDASLKAMLTISQTGASAVAEFGKVELAAPAAKTRAKKSDAAAVPAATGNFALLEGDAEGTRYFLIEKHFTVSRVLPGEAVISIDGTVEVDGATYAAKKEEFAKKSLTSVSATQTAAPASVSTTAATASVASSSEATVSFKQVVEKLMELSKDARPGKGREAIVGFLAKHNVKTVPMLESLGKPADLLAEVEALMAPDAEVDIFG